METRSEMEEALKSLSILKSSSQLPSDYPMAFTQLEDNSSPLVKQLRRLLFHRMLVGVNDGCFFMGSFHCIDKQGNIIHQDAVEYRGTRCNCPSPMEQRCLGLILIPSSCRTSCHVDCAIERADVTTVTLKLMEVVNLGKDVSCEEQSVDGMMFPCSG